MRSVFYPFSVIQATPTSVGEDISIPLLLGVLESMGYAQLAMVCII
jgi:hypothetical protein